MTKAMTKEEPLGTIHTIPLADITISQGNVRLADPTKDLDELAASIKKHGLLQPVVLLGEYGKPPYELISGQRRFIAHQKILKLPNIRAVFAGRLSKTQQVVRSLVENLQRRELEYIDTAKAVTQLYKDFGKDEHKVHEETGLSLRKIRDLILIDERATPKMRTFLKAGKVKPADVKRAIRAAQDNLKKAEELLELIIEYKPTAHQKRRLVMYGEQDGRASADKILREAMKPHVEQSIVIALPDDIRAALTKATKSTSMEPEELAVKVLGDWLRDQGFI
jgi:ParB family chromosome partitioning protein